MPVLLFIFLESKKGIKAFSLILLLLLAFVMGSRFEAILKKEFNGAKILMYRGSRYGPIIAIKKSGVSSFYINGSLAATSEDTAFNEEFFHTALSSRKNIESVLILGTSFPEQIHETLKHPVKSVDLLDINPALSKLHQEYVEKAFLKKVHVITDDPRHYLRASFRKYDMIIMVMPPPTSLGLNRFFTKEFFRLAKMHLNDNGVFAFSIPSKRDILSPHILRFNSCIINTLDAVFDKRLLIPADTMIVLASKNNPVDRKNLIKTFVNRRIKTDYLTRYHLTDSLDKTFSDYLNGMLQKDTPLNRDLRPFGFLYYLLVEQAKFYPHLSISVPGIKPVAITCFVCLVVLLAFGSLIIKKPFTLLNAAITGFMSIGTTTVIFVLFQITSGVLFWKMGILVGLFMLGLSASAYLINNIPVKFKVTRPMIASFYFAWTFFLGGFLLLSQSFNEGQTTTLIIYAASFFCGILTGCLYPLLSRMMYKGKVQNKNIAVFIYAADLFGAFVGTLAFSALFIPFLGVGLSLGLLIFLAGIFSLKNLFV